MRTQVNGLVHSIMVQEKIVPLHSTENQFWVENWFRIKSWNSQEFTSPQKNFSLLLLATNQPKSTMAVWVVHLLTDFRLAAWLYWLTGWMVTVGWPHRNDREVWTGRLTEWLVACLPGWQADSLTAVTECWPEPSRFSGSSGWVRLQLNPFTSGGLRAKTGFRLGTGTCEI